MNVASLRQWMAGYSSHSRGRPPYPLNPRFDLPRFYKNRGSRVGRKTIKSVPKPWKMVIIIPRPGAEEEHAKEYPWQLMK